MGRICGRCGCSSCRTATWSQKLIVAPLVKNTLYCWLGHGDQWYCAGLEIWSARNLEGTWGNSVVMFQTDSQHPSRRIHVRCDCFKPYSLQDALWGHKIVDIEISPKERDDVLQT